jgi:hypothetical protein
MLEYTVLQDGGSINMAAVNFRYHEPAREMIYMTTFNFRFYLPREI